MNAAYQLDLLLDKKDFIYLKNKLFDLAGIHLSDIKIELVQSRLKSRLSSLNLTSYSHYVRYLKGLSSQHEEWQIFINLLTTNKTSWFREMQHFDYLVNTFLPKWLLLGKRHLQVWCAASSTGEEPYSLSLVLNEALKDSGVSYEILASDIDTKVLSHAANGVYPVEVINQVPNQYRQYFVHGTQDVSGWMKVKKVIKAPIKFSRINLLDEFSWTDKFDVIFCRNVFIYFNKETIQKISCLLYEAASSESMLFIAHAESLQNLSTPWHYIKPSIYAKGKMRK